MGKGRPVNGFAYMERVTNFVHLYLMNGRNPVAAYQTIFPNTKHPNHAAANANKYLNKAPVQAELARQMLILNEKLDYSKEKILNELVMMFENNKIGTTGEKKVALDAIKLLTDIMGIKASIKVEQTNYNIDLPPLQINFIEPIDIEPTIDEPKNIEGEK